MPKKKDNILKDYMSNNVIFSDIINYYIYDGKQVVKDTDLIELDTTVVNTNDEIFEKTRDLIKEVNIKEDNNSTYILFGIENQTKMDYEMVSRIFLYDSLLLRKQFKNRKNNDKIKPVITIVIYYGKRKWNLPKSLHDYYSHINKELLGYVPNYYLNIIEPYQMDDNDIDKLKSDFKVICDFIRNSNTAKELSIVLNKNYIVSNDTIKLINYITDSKLEINESEDEVEMCRGIEELKEIARAEGVKQGYTDKEKSNIKTMNKNGASPELIAKLLGLNIDYVQNILES